MPSRPPRSALATLDEGESVRVAIARTLALEPALLVIDEPIRGVDLLERDGILALLRSLADEGIAVLASTAESTGLAGADRGARAQRRRAARRPAGGARDRPAAAPPGRVAGHWVSGAHSRRRPQGASMLELERVVKHYRAG